MAHLEEAVELMGGRGVLGPELKRHGSLLEAVRAGLPFAALESLAAQLDLSGEAAAALLQVPRRTLARRRASRVLSREESDRVARVARIAGRTIEVLGTRPKAVAWLRRPLRALGGATPFSLLDTDLGTADVERVLGRIEHGVYS
jgi:putative toxin-antitoxin system antitoxin component (TIGR02293 family)